MAHQCGILREGMAEIERFFDKSKLERVIEKGDHLIEITFEAVQHRIAEDHAVEGFVILF